MRKPIIAITMGDPGGVGPEVAVRALDQCQSERGCHYILLGAKEVLEVLRKKRRLGFSLQSVPASGRFLSRTNDVYFWDITRESRRLFGGREPSQGDCGFDIGKVSRRNAVLAFAALKTAADYATKGWIDAIVTAPVNKAAMRLIDPSFKGHTEYLAQTAKAKSFAMMFVGDKLKLTLVTIHVALKDVAGQISRKQIAEKIVLTHQFLKKRFRILNPRIGVCALNPHGPETGSEEKTIIAPAVAMVRKRGINALGPFSADQLFYEAYSGRYDALISMYHDQGLGPFKMVSFNDGVNVTLGLPFVRTSPDHGTAYDIAYRGMVNPSSMTAALKLAQKLSKV